MNQTEFQFETICTPNGDGTFTLKPGKPVVKPKSLTVAQFAAEVEINLKTAYDYLDLLKEEGLARKSGPRLWKIDPAAVQWWLRNWN